MKLMIKTFDRFGKENVLHSLAAMILFRKSTGEETNSQQGSSLAYKITRISIVP
jgi:hypothetical protein